MHADFPDLLTTDAGEPIKTADEWTRKRVRQLWKHFENCVYGKKPDGGCLNVESQHEFVVDSGTVRIDRLEFRSGVTSLMLVALPDGPGPFPTFIGLNFGGIHTVLDRPEVPLRPGSKVPRGSHSLKWPLDQILADGFGLATACYEDFCPDDPSQADGLHAKGTGAISVWAEALSRMRGVVSLDPRCCPNRMVAIGHSRLGKAALLACARDPNFAACVSIQSGCGGAAPSRTDTGETVADITRVFPHWFVPGFASFAGREADLPIDQHGLLALCAPRPLLLLNAMEDQWANPLGQVAMMELARPVYDLFGASEGLEWDTRPGKHEVLPMDWERAMAFAQYRLEDRPFGAHRSSC